MTFLYPVTKSNMMIKIQFAMPLIFTTTMCVDRGIVAEETRKLIKRGRRQKRVTREDLERNFSYLILCASRLKLNSLFFQF